MGAAGFEPATTWSEAKHSIQTELSARDRRYFTNGFKPRDPEPAVAEYRNDGTVPTRSASDPIGTGSSGSIRGFGSATGDQKEYYSDLIWFS